MLRRIHTKTYLFEITKMAKKYINGKKVTHQHLVIYFEDYYYIENFN